MPPTADAHSLHDTVSRDDAGAPTHPPPEDSPPTPAPGDHNNHDNRDQQQDREDSSQEESSDEEERPYWAEFVEDTSAPDEQELLDIGLDGSEVDATDRKIPTSLPQASLTWTRCPLGIQDL